MFHFVLFLLHKFTSNMAGWFAISRAIGRCLTFYYKQPFYLNVFNQFRAYQ